MKKLRYDAYCNKRNIYVIIDESVTELEGGAGNSLISKYPTYRCNLVSSTECRDCVAYRGSNIHFVKC